MTNPGAAWTAPGMGNIIMKTKPIKIDGAFGEGGGQIIRTSLALAMTTGRSVHISRIRTKRKKPGLLRQHLTALNAAKEICGARVQGNELGSKEVTFQPGAIASGSYTFRIGSAGSATLVLQTVLPALLVADGPSEISIEGGTHNPFAPPYPFVEQVFVPLLNRMGAQIETRLERHGFYPAGGGRISATIRPDKLRPLHLTKCRKPLEASATAIVCNIDASVGKRKLKVLGRKLGIPDGRLILKKATDAAGIGNAAYCSLTDGNTTEVITGFGERGVSAEQVANRMVKTAKQFIDSGVPVGTHLADQLMVPMVLAGGGSFRTSEPDMHATTNLEIIKKIYTINAGFTRESDTVYRFEMKQGE